MKNYPLNDYCDIPINLLKIWSDNPRIGTALDEKNAINLLIETVGFRQMINLAKDILENGLAETEIPSVVQENKQFFVYDGNRRLSCIKLFLDPSIIDDSEIRQRFKNILKDIPKDALSKFHIIKVFNTTKERALQLMDLAHNGEQEGVGRVTWEAYQRDLALYKRHMTPKYRTAFYISILMFKSPKKKNFDGGPSYTDLDRIFGSNVIKECIGVTSDYSQVNQNEIEKIQQAYCILKEARADLKIHAFSRFFNNLTPDNENVKKFIDYYNKKVGSIQSKLELEQNNYYLDKEDVRFNSEGKSQNEANGKTEEAVSSQPEESNGGKKIESNVNKKTDEEFAESNGESIDRNKVNKITEEEKADNQSEKSRIEDKIQASVEGSGVENDQLPKNTIRRTTRNTLITDSNWEIKYSKLPDTYAPIRSLIYHLKRITFDDDKIPDNTLILTLLLRALIDQTTKAYRELNDLKVIDNDLEGAIRVTSDHLKINDIVNIWGRSFFVIIKLSKKERPQCFLKKERPQCFLYMVKCGLWKPMSKWRVLENC